LSMFSNRVIVSVLLLCIDCLLEFRYMNTCQVDPTLETPKI
jgi:hypothetical protein